ncbi:MAG: type II toxin-antitoxin system HicB family antitoxin [Ardenticatenaceae bacterium]
MKYKIALKKTEEGYSVSCPRLPGCWLQGETEEEARRNMAKTHHTVTRRTFLRHMVGAGVLVAGAQVGLVGRVAAFPWPRTLQQGDQGRDVGEL